MTAYLWTIAVLVALTSWGADCLFWFGAERGWGLEHELEGPIMASLVPAAPHVALAYAATIKATPPVPRDVWRFFFGASVAGLVATIAFAVLKFAQAAAFDALSLGLLMCSSPLVVVAAMLAGGAACRALRPARADVTR